MARSGQARHQARSLVAWGLLVLALAAGFAVLTRPTHRHLDPPPARPGATLGPCIRTGALTSVRRVNTFIDHLRADASFAGGDVGASLRLGDGREAFVFGDTLRGPRGSQTLVRNSMVLFDHTCARVVVPPRGGPLVPDRADGVGYWPMSLARVSRPGHDLVGIGLQRVRATSGNGVFSFEILGPALARFEVAPGGAPRLVSVVDVGPDSTDTERPMWGAASVVSGGWVYLYGTSRSPSAQLSGFALRVARARIDGVTRPRTWQYWSSHGWSSDPRAAAVLIPARGGVSETLSVFRSGHTWYALSKQDEVFGRYLTIWSAPRPTGPFTVASRAASIPSDATTGTLRYMPLAHTELLPRPGTVVVSYSENNSDVQLIRDDPRRYRPRFLRVQLPD